MQHHYCGPIYNCAPYCYSLIDGRERPNSLLTECRSLNGYETGHAKITKGYKLPAKFIIHTVGPVWYGGQNNEAVLLASCYKECMLIAKEHKLSSIAFPAISCGVYHFPILKACKIAINEVLNTA